MHTCTHLALSVVTLCGLAHRSAAQPCDPGAIDAAVDQLLADFPVMLDGACLVIGNADGIIYEGYFGQYDAATVLPLASASKLVSAIGVMTLVDSGHIDPHQPIVHYLPEMFAPQRAGDIKPFMSVDQMYSMTCGLAGDATDSILNDLSLTMEQAVDLIATTSIPVALPSTEINYTGLGMHVAGYLCSVRSGKPFDQFYANAVSIPLNTPSIDWDGLGETQNFRPSGGGESTARDYARLLRMLLRRGELDGVRILSEQAVNSMFIERTVALPYGDVPPDAEELGWGYAFGMWVEQRDDSGHAIIVSSPGAFGATPWIDLEDGYWGVLLADGVGTLIRPDFFVIRDAVESSLIHAPCTPCRADLTHDGRLGFFDVQLFLRRFSEGDRLADWNDDHAFDFYDVQGYLNDYADCG